MIAFTASDDSAARADWARMLEGFPAACIHADARWLDVVGRVYGVERAGSVTYQSAQTTWKGAPLRLFVVGFEPARPGGPRKLFSGRDLMRSHYEMIVDRSAGLAIGEQMPLGNPRSHIHRRRPDARRTHRLRRSGRLRDAA